MNGGAGVPWPIIVLGLLIVLLFAAAPFLLTNNPVAQLFFSLILAIITTLVSIYATRHYSMTQVREDLTRYGLQAWRSLDSLQVKISQHLGSNTISEATLQAWILDVDGAKWAWRDLLRQIFEVQDRLQAESEEVVQRFKKLISDSPTDEERSRLEAKQAAELAALKSQAPLALKLPEEITCPMCSTILTARVGPNIGDSDWLTCPKPGCGAKFPVFRKADGTVQGSDRPIIATAVNPCPKCGAELRIPFYEDREISFLTTCASCHTHLQFTGTPAAQKLTDLGVENATYMCPFCETQSSCWIAPGRRVSFKRECSVCHKEVRISGTQSKFDVRPA